MALRGKEPSPMGKAMNAPKLIALMSAAKTGTPRLENPSAKTWRATVFPVPVTPAINPCRNGLDNIFFQL